MAKTKNELRKRVAPQEFVASISYDHRLAPYDLEASKAHVEMLGRQRIISSSEQSRLLTGLRRLSEKVRKGQRLAPAEDIHFAIEKAMFQAVGPVAGKLHTARSRNDQVVTAFRLYLRDHIDQIKGRLADLAEAFLAQAEGNPNAVMPGFTHLQPGQPVLASHHLLAYAWMFVKDQDRLDEVRRRTNILPLGAAALAGTSFPIDRLWVARRLGFDGVMPNSIEAVSDRDFLVDFLSAASLVMVHLSRFGEELVIWSNPSFGYVTLADPFVTGSSIMPQKRNPDMAELVRGKAGRVFGDLVALLTTLKAQPLAYNRDLQEDKPPVFDAVETVSACLDVMTPMVRTMTLHAEKTRESCRWGFLLATDVADALVRRGMAFRQAHGVVADVVRSARAKNISLEDMPLDAWRKFSPLFGPWVRDVLSLDKAVAARASLGGTAPKEVRRQIRRLRALLKIGVFLIGLSSLLPFRARSDEAPMERTLTLEQSIDTALQNNQALISAEEGIHIAEQRVWESKSQLYPKIGLNFSASRYLAEQDYVLPPEFGSVLFRPSRELEPDTFYTTRVWLKQPLYNGGRTRDNILLAKASLKQTRIRREGIRAQVVYDATRSFYDVLLARQQIALYEEAARDAESLAAQMPSKPQRWLMDVQALQDRFRRGLDEKRRREEKAYLEYLNHLGVELYTRVGLEGKLETKITELDQAKLLAQAQESRLEIQGTEYQKEIDRLAVNLSQSERHPVVSLGAGYEMNDFEFPLDTIQWNATFNISLPVFDGFSSRSRIRQKKMQASQNRILRTEIEDQINKDVRDSHSELLYWQNEIARREDELRRAQATIADLQSGSEWADLARAREWLLENQLAYWEAIHGHRVAMARLAQAVGKP
ncbi:MAG: argininosuccinate lyase [Elusimicrobia bacterium]|nr:argininosuccinate lyase [Elusimicrobiota bacterium]